MKRICISLMVLCLPMTVIGALRAADPPQANKAPAGKEPAAVAAAAKSEATDSRAADEAAIRASGAAFLEAYNAGDAKKLAALWSPDAVYLDPLTGETTVGRDAIEKVFAEAFADKQEVKLSVESANVEFIAPSVAIVRGVGHVTRKGEEPVDSDF